MTATPAPDATPDAAGPDVTSLVVSVLGGTGEQGRGLARRLALTQHDDPVKVELELNGYLPAAERGDFSLRMILHGRRICFAQRPECGRCTLEDICPSSQLPRRTRRPRRNPTEGSTT